MKGTFTINIPVTPENMPALDAMRAWSESIPSVYCLDICSVSRIKKALALAKAEEESPFHDPHIAALKRLDRPQNAISYFTALMEKASDQHSPLRSDGLIEEAERDLDAIGAFFSEARVFEPKDFAFSFIRELNGKNLEILGENYHSYLQSVNSSGIYNSLSASKRFVVAELICDEARKFSISASHPVVLASLACIYGCRPAKKVMKFKKNPEEFNSSNALADIQIIQRVGKLSQMVEDARISGKCQYMRTLPITADVALEEFCSMFTMNAVESKPTEFGARDTFTLTIKAPKLFPALHNDGGIVKDSDCEKELMELYGLISRVQNEASS